MSNLTKSGFTGDKDCSCRSQGDDRQLRGLQGCESKEVLKMKNELQREKGKE